MTENEAIQIVLDLAEQNIIDDPDMKDETKRQEQAIAIVRSLLKCW